jgi:hypothetical protein
VRFAMASLCDRWRAVSPLALFYAGEAFKSAGWVARSTWPAPTTDAKGVLNPAWRQLRAERRSGRECYPRRTHQVVAPAHAIHVTVQGVPRLSWS